MQSSLYVALSAQLSLQRRIDTIANNIANSATAGGVSAPPNTLVVLVKTRVATPTTTASSRRLSVPTMLVSMKSCML
jgi:flagellar basal body rod protein FlgG